MREEKSRGRMSCLPGDEREIQQQNQMVTPGRAPHPSAQRAQHFRMIAFPSCLKDLEKECTDRSKAERLLQGDALPSFLGHWLDPVARGCSGSLSQHRALCTFKVLMPCAAGRCQAEFSLILYCYEMHKPVVPSRRANGLVANSTKASSCEPWSSCPSGLGWISGEKSGQMTAFTSDG